MQSRKELLKKNLPSFLKKYPNTVSYIEAAGGFIDDAVEAIINLSNSHKYDKTGEFGLNAALLELGFDLPPNVSEATKRQLLRDGMEFIIRSGTTDAIIAAFRLIGISAQLQEAWIVSPDLVRKGKIFDIENGVIKRYDISNSSYQDMLYGTASVKETGVYFSGHAYNDFFRENLIENIPIMGEHYDAPIETEYVVGKSPYALVFINDATVNLVTEESIDPDTGEVFSYSQNERFALINDIIEYFAYKSNRPTNMRIIVIISPAGGADFDDAFGIEEGAEVDDDVEHLDFPAFEETSEIEEEYSRSATVTISSVSVGDPILIGMPSPYESQFSIVDLSSTDDLGVLTELNWEGLDGLYTISHYPSEGRMPLIPMYPNARIKVVAPVGGISLKGYQYPGAVAEDFGGGSEGITLNMSNLGRFHLVGIEYGNPELVDEQLIEINLSV